MTHPMFMLRMFDHAVLRIEAQQTSDALQAMDGFLALYGAVMALKDGSV